MLFALNLCNIKLCRDLKTNPQQILNLIESQKLTKTHCVNKKSGNNEYIRTSNYDEIKVKENPIDRNG